MKIVWGALVTDGSGKLGGHVASKNRGGSYLRTKVKPANAQTPAQQNARNRLSTFAQGWRGLTELQRESWNNAVSNFPVVKNGRTQFLSGEQLYVRLNANLVLIGESPIDTAPLPGAIPELIIDGVSADVSSNAVLITSLSATVPMGFSLVLFATAPYSPGKYNVSNKYRFIGLVTLAMGSFDAHAMYEAKFGSLVAGQKLSVKCFLISTTTGQAGIPTTQNCIITA